MNVSATSLAALFALPALLPGLLPAQGTADSKKVDALFADWNRKDSPGAAVLVVKDGKVVHRKGYGMADLEHGVPITPETVFDIASVSKQFCGLAIAMLVEQKKIGIDDDVRKHVEWVPDFGGRKITIRHLVHHTSGIRDWPGALRLAGCRFDDVISFRQILNMLRHQRDLNFDPGAEYSYSNTGYNLLARIVEKMSGVTFAIWTRGHLFDPLGMGNTHFHDDHTLVVKNRARAYRKTRFGWDNIGNQLTAVGSSSLFTTIDDLAKWILNFETNKVGGKRALDRMHTRGKLNAGKEIAYCYGVSKGNYEEMPTVSHSGSWAGFRTYLVRFPQRRFAVVVLANTDTIDPSELSNEIASIYLGVRSPSTLRFLRILNPNFPAGAGAWANTPQPLERSAKQLQVYAGRYYSVELDTTYTIAPKGTDLATQHFRNEQLTLRQSPRRDRFTGSAWWAGTVHFLRNKQGEVVALTVTSSRCRNVRFDRVTKPR